MKKFFNKVFFSKTASGIFTLLAALGLLLSNSVRYGYVFVDNAVFGGASFGFYIFSIFSSAFLFAYFCLKIRDNSVTDKAVMKVLAFIGEFVGFLLALYSLIAALTDPQATMTIVALFKDALPIWAGIVGVLFLLFVYPAIKGEKLKKVIASVSVIVLVFITYASFFPLTPYKLTSSPAVFDNGNGSYSVVFSTNDEGVGYVEYEYKGKQVKVFDENNGRKNNSKIHSVTVPKQELSGNTYTVGSTRVIDELSYGGRNGKTVVSKPIKFIDNFDDNINVLTISDWHTCLDTAKTAAEKLGDYGALVLLGDCSPSLMSDRDVSKYIVEFAGDLTNGEMPIIYTRGNHETRGREATKLSGYLGIDCFYFTTKLGKYDIIVLDSCEDKDDSHPEYGGMVDYTSYRTKMVESLCRLPEDNTGNTVVFCHSKDICIEEDLSKTALDKIDRLGTSLLVSGHEHKFNFIDDGSFPVLVDGGIDANGKGTFTACMLKFSNSGIKIDCVDNNGEKVVDENVAWRASK